MTATEYVELFFEDVSIKNLSSIYLMFLNEAMDLCKEIQTEKEMYEILEFQNSKWIQFCRLVPKEIAPKEQGFTEALKQAAPEFHTSWMQYRYRMY